jgi:hypothetical protein
VRLGVVCKVILLLSSERARQFPRRSLVGNLVNSGNGATHYYYYYYYYSLLLRVGVCRDAESSGLPPNLSQFDFLARHL